MDPLDDFLNGPEPEGETVSDDVVETPQLETPIASTPRDEQGRFAPKGEQQPVEAQEAPPVAAPPAAENEPPPWKGQIEERRKRQDAERRAEELQQRLQAYEQGGRQSQYQAPAQQGSNVPVVFDDEYAQSIFEQAVSYVRQEMTPQLHSTKMDLVRDMVRSRHDDYDDVEAAYVVLMRDNPALHAEVMRQPNPVQYAYDQTKRYLEFQQHSAINPADLRAQIRAEVMAELNAKPTTPQTIPTSLADAQSARGSASTAPTGPPSLNDILGRK